MIVVPVVRRLLVAEGERGAMRARRATAARVEVAVVVAVAVVVVVVPAARQWPSSAWATDRCRGGRVRS